MAISSESAGIDSDATAHRDIFGNIVALVDVDQFVVDVADANDRRHRVALEICAFEREAVR